MGVRKIGFGATSGEVAELKTEGLYRYYRYPEYVADMAILPGWAVRSASGGRFMWLPLVSLFWLPRHLPKNLD